MFLKELEIISHSAHFTTILSLVSLTINLLLGAILFRNLTGLRRLEQGMKFLLIVNSQKQRSSDIKSEGK